MEKHAMVIDGEDDMPQIVFENKCAPGVGKITFDTKTSEAFSRVLKPGSKVKIGSTIRTVPANHASDKGEL